MSRAVTVTMTVELQLEIPTSWAEEDVADKLGDVLVVDIKSTSKRVVVEDQGEQSIELDDYEEDEG